MGTLEPEERNSLQVEPFPSSLSSMGAPENAHCRGTPLPPVTGKPGPLISLGIPDA